MPTAPTGTARVEFIYGQHTEERANVLHVYKTTDWSDAELNQLATDFYGVWLNYIKPISVDDLKLIEIIATDIGDPTPHQQLYTCTTNCSGSGTVNPAPGNATHTISWRSSGIGRRKRGRSFLPGMADQDINDDDTVTSGRLTGVSLVAIQLMLAAIANGANLAVYSRVANAVSIVIGYVLENILDTQRRRLPGRGR